MLIKEVCQCFKMCLLLLHESWKVFHHLTLRHPCINIQVYLSASTSSLRLVAIKLLQEISSGSAQTFVVGSTRVLADIGGLKVIFIGISAYRWDKIVPASSFSLTKHLNSLSGLNLCHFLRASMRGGASPWLPAGR